MKHYESGAVLCPFYHGEVARELHCEGTEDNNVLHMVFWSPSRKENYKSRFCCADYERCLLCAALIAKYNDST